MTILLSSAKSSSDQQMPIADSAQSDSLWQRMINSWIHTYELCTSSGTVPFMFL